MARTTTRRKPRSKHESRSHAGPAAAAAKELQTTRDQASAYKLFKKGYSLQKRGEASEAVKFHLKGLKLDKNSVYGLKVLGEALALMGRRQWAISTYERALELDPEDAETYGALGNLALNMEMLDVAAQFFSMHIQKRPDDPVGYNNLATVLRQQEKLDDAIALLKQVIPQQPTASILWNALAAAVYDRDGLDAALPFYEEALRLDPNSSMALSNLARCMEHKGDFERGIELAERAIRSNRRLAEPRLVLAYCQLSLGRLEQGWQNYPARQDPQRPTALHYTHGLPEWRGEDISDKRLLVCPEQGIGDEIIFATVFGETIERAGKCFIGCDRRLVPLLSRTFPHAKFGGYTDRYSEALRYRSLPFAEAEGVEHADLAIPAGELMKFFRPTVESFPEQRGYLKPDPDRVTFWRSRLDALGPEPKVGICWRSGKQNIDRNRHYTSLDQWGPIFAVDGVHFVNLQYDDCTEELEAARARNNVAIHVWDDINLKNDIDDVAALTAALDLVISPATTVATMAMAVGTDLIGLLRVPPFWAFGLKDTTPLLARSRLFYWPEGGEWPETIDAVAAALKERARN